LEPNATQPALNVGERVGFYPKLKSRGVLLFLYSLIEEPYHLVFIQAAMLCPKHIHHTLVSPHQMLPE
jgi:hypothetical protein